MNPRPLEKIDALTDGQRQQLADWLLTETLDKARELAEQEFGADIPRSTLHRFRKRCEMSDYLDPSSDSARTRAELINAAASSKPNFCQATIDLLEKQAFELAHTLRDEGALDALKNLFGLINHHKNTAVRERMAAVQERKARLREEELALKRTDRAANSDFGLRNLNLSDDLGPLATTLDEIEARATKKFCLPPLPPTQNPLSEAHDSSATSESHESLSSSVSLPEPSSESLSETSSQGASESQDLPDRSASITTVAPESSSLACFPFVPSVLSPAIVSHALRRWLAHTPFRPGMPPRDQSWNEECPCGAKLPCDHHGDLWREVRYVKPSNSDYAAALERYGIPVYTPTPEELQPADSIQDSDLAVQFPKLGITNPAIGTP